MDFIWQSLQAALDLIISGDAEVYKTVATSLHVAGVATVIAEIIGISVGAVVGLYHILLRRTVVNDTLSTFPRASLASPRTFLQLTLERIRSGN